MSSFDEIFRSLNEAQRQAVERTEGPLLVIAGPGTGKTQLLSARVAQILRTTDTLPHNILCLTFTESGAENMRERLTQFIGQAAYDVQISTYHGFGSDIIQRFPQYFTATQLQNPVDQLGKHEVLRTIIDNLSYTSPLKQLRHHIGDLVSTISEIKRALLSPDDLRAIADANLIFISSANTSCKPLLDTLANQSRITNNSIPTFDSILTALQGVKSANDLRFGSLADLARERLRSALDEAAEQRTTKPLTAWKNTWLAKDDANHYIFEGTLQNRRILALADVFEAYQNALAARGLYDFDDMIARSIEAMQAHADLKFTLQEQYLYLLLDEFQDTNAAQLKLVELLTDNPVHEGRPNVMAVGDDDQAIYAFQGAEYSNMRDFYRLFRDVEVINLTENYRSHADILSSAANVATQIEARLHHQFPGMTKQLLAANTRITSSHIVRQQLVSDVAQYDWIAGQIARLIERGTEPHEIAVLAPKHRYLEPLIAHLNERNIPVQYEKRENILRAPVILQLVSMSRLVLALARGDHDTADALWPEILSYEFWHIPIKDIWTLSWRITDDRDHKPNWTRALLETPEFAKPALLFSTLAMKTHTETCETMLDYLIGSEPVTTNDTDQPEVRSPLRAHFTTEQLMVEQPNIMFETMTQLKVLQGKLREHQATENRTLLLEDLITYIEMYEAAGEQLLNTSPYHQHANAVQLMTVFKAKGLEFEHVFLPSCHDDVWGETSRGSKNNLTLPANLDPIRHAGATDDERLRILFVALTRAKQGLYLTSFAHTFTGKRTKRLKYLNEQEQPDGTFRCQILPESVSLVLEDTNDTPPLLSLELDWRTPHLHGFEDGTLKDLLRHRLQRYQLSPTHLNQFVDLTHCGPQEFLFRTLLRFPSAPSISGQYGNAIHETLEWYQHRLNETSTPPTHEATLSRFTEYMRAKRLTTQETDLHIERGHAALRSWLNQRAGIFEVGGMAERNFRNENVFLGKAHLTGKIDRLEIDHKTKRITVVDYKTGTARPKWVNTDVSLHKYRQQLYCYKLLIERSRSFAGYTVDAGRLEFIEPDDNGRVHQLNLTFDLKELARTEALIASVWEYVTTLTMPDTSDFSNDLKGTLAFEDYLIEHHSS